MLYPLLCLDSTLPLGSHSQNIDLLLTSAYIRTIRDIRAISEVRLT